MLNLAIDLNVHPIMNFIRIVGSLSYSVVLSIVEVLLRCSYLVFNNLQHITPLSHELKVRYPESPYSFRRQSQYYFELMFEPNNES